MVLSHPPWPMFRINFSLIRLENVNNCSMGSNLEPAIRSPNTGPRIPCFDRCQLIITWMCNIKEVHGKPRLHVFVNLLFGTWPSCCSTLSLSSCIRAHEQYPQPREPRENQFLGFPFLPLLTFPYEYGATVAPLL